MPQTRTQTYANHVRLVPLYHGVLVVLLVANLVGALLKLRHGASAESLLALATAVGLLLLAYYTRHFALTVQDRVIRLEVRLRLQALAPELVPGLGRLSVPQLVALRFAGDAELADLVREVLEGRLGPAAEIKRRIRDWQPDFLRV